MLHSLKTMAAGYDRYMTFIGRRRACEVLLQGSDRMLKDAGFSRELLEQGVAGWPWTASDNELLQPVAFHRLSSSIASDITCDTNSVQAQTRSTSTATTVDIAEDGSDGADYHAQQKVA